MQEYAQEMIDNMNLRIDDSAKEALNPENYESFCRVMWRFPQFDYRNQLLIWNQAKDAECIASKYAIEHSGHEFEKKNKIFLFTPEVDYTDVELIKTNSGELKVTKRGGIPLGLSQNVSSIKLIPSVYYSVKDKHADKHGLSRDELIERFSSYTKYKVTYSSIPSDSRVEKSDQNNQTLILKEGLSDDQMTTAIIKNLVDFWKFRKLDEDEDFKKQYNDPNTKTSLWMDCVMAFERYTLHGFFGIDYPNRDISGISAKLYEPDFDFENEDYLEIVKEISYTVRMIIEHMTGTFLTFDEVNILKKYIGFGDRRLIIMMLLLLTRSLDDKHQSRYDCIDLIDTLHFISEDSFQKILERGKKNELYTYPPFYWEISPSQDTGSKPKKAGSSGDYNLGEHVFSPER